MKTLQDIQRERGCGTAEAMRIQSSSSRPCPLCQDHALDVKPDGTEFYCHPKGRYLKAGDIASEDAWIDVKKRWPLFGQIMKVRSSTVDGKWKEFKAAVNGSRDQSYWVYAVTCQKVEWPEWITHWKPLDGEPLEFGTLGPK